MNPDWFFWPTPEISGASRRGAEPAEDAAALAAALATARKDGEIAGLRRALDLARGSKDFRGGYYGAEYDAYHQGMDTVARVLEKAIEATESGVPDSQSGVVEGIGAEMRERGER